MRKILFIVLLMILALDAKNTISKEAYKNLQKAQKLIKQKSYTSALNILKPIVNTSDNAYEKSYALQSLANIYIQKNNYPKVATYYEKILKLKVLEKKDLNKIRFSLSQIYLSSNSYNKSIRHSKAVLNASGVSKKKVIENLAIAYYNSGQYRSSTKYIQQFINTNPKKKESWYRMLYSAHIESKNYNGAIKTLKYMINVYSKNENYWMQLISIYQKTKRYKKTLALLELAYKKNAINKKENVSYFVNLLLRNKIYNKAGLTIEKSFRAGTMAKNRKNFNLMVSAYSNAKNYKKVIQKLSTSKFAYTDRYRLLLGNIYFNKSDYKNTVKVLKNYKFAKNTKYDGQRYTLLALSAYELQNSKQAVNYLKKASGNKYEKRRALSLARDLGYKI